MIFISILFFLCAFIFAAFLYIYSLRRSGKPLKGRGDGVIFCLLCGLLSALFGIKFFQSDLVFTFLCVSSLLLLGAISVCDETSGYIPDELLFLLFLSMFITTTENYTDYVDILVVFLDCGAFFLLLRYISQFILSTETIGWGDIKLAACIGGLLGGSGAVIALIFSVLFAVVGLALNTFLVPRSKNSLPIQKEEETEFFPLASSLSAGCLLALFCGGDLIATIFSPFVAL